MMRKKDDNDEERQRIDHKEKKSHKNGSKLLSDLNIVPTKINNKTLCLAAVDQLVKILEITFDLV